MTITLPSAIQESRSGALSLLPPHEPLGFLGVIDPNASVDVMIDEAEPALQSAGVTVMIDYVATNPDSYVALPLWLFAENVTAQSTGSVPDLRSADYPGTVIVGASPPFIDASSSPGNPSVLLWGSISGQGPGFDNTYLGPISVSQRSSTPPDVDYIGGDGRVRNASTQPLLIIDPDSLGQLDVNAGTQPAEVTSGFTCYCAVEELKKVAAEMTAAEQASGSGRVYFAQVYGALFGPVEHSAAVSSLATAALPLLALIAVAGLVAVAAGLLSSRGIAANRAEVLCGAGTVPLHLRQQFLISLTITLPMAAGFLVMDRFVQGEVPPPPWPPGGGGQFLLALAVLQVFAGTGTAIRLQRLIRYPLGKE